MRKTFHKSKFSDEVGMEHWFVDVKSAIDYVSTQTNQQHKQFSNGNNENNNEHKIIELKTMGGQDQHQHQQRKRDGVGFDDNEEVPASPENENKINSSSVCEEVSRFSNNNRRESIGTASCSFRGESIVSI